MEIGSEFKSLGDTIAGILPSTEGFGFSWETIGNIISGVVTFLIRRIVFFVGMAGAALGIVVGAVQSVINVWNSLRNVVVGVWNVISGILTGNWSKAWLGAKQVFFGVINGMMTMLLEFVARFGGIIDAVARTFGKELNIKDTVKDFQAFMSKDLAANLGVEGTVAGVPAAVAPSAALPPASPNAEGALTPQPAVVAATSPATSVTKMDTGSARQPIVTQIELKVSEEVLARAVHRSDQDSADRGFSPVPSY
jgi:hypothetical protein